MARNVRGVRAKLPPNSFVGRLGGSGAAGIISLKDVATALQINGGLTPAGAPVMSIVSAGTGIGVSVSGSTYTVALQTPVTVGHGGTGADLSATGGAHQVLKQSSAGAAVTVGQLAATDISGLAAIATSGSASDLIAGTVNTARVAGSYTGITAVGTLGSLSVTGASGGSNLTISEAGTASHYFQEVLATSYGSNSDNFSIFFAGRSRGTSGSPTAVQSGDILGAFAGAGYGATKLIGSANIEFVATENWTDTANGTKLILGSVANGASGNSNRFEVGQDGSLIATGVTGGSQGSGTINAAGLYVNGSPIATAGAAGHGLGSQVLSATPSQASTGLSTWVNQGSATTRDGATGLVISLPGVSANNFRALSKTLAAPYTISALFCLTSQAQNFFGGGIGWVDTVNSKAHVIALIRNGDAQVNVERWSTFSAIGSNDSSNGNNETCQIWLQIQNDGTNLTWRFSRDGDNWIDAHTETLAGSYMGATNYGKVCFFLNPSQQSGTLAACIGVLMSYKET